MYALGLSCSAASHLPGALGAEVCKTSVWRDAQEAGEALRRSRPVGRVRVLGADETVFKVKGKELVVGFVTDEGGGRTLGFEVLFDGDGRTFKEWLEPYAKLEKNGARITRSSRIFPNSPTVCGTVTGPPTRCPVADIVRCFTVWKDEGRGGCPRATSWSGGNRVP
jgi:hypothetical protein